jgi:hypothetical protein
MMKNIEKQTKRETSNHRPEKRGCRQGVDAGGSAQSGFLKKFIGIDRRGM